MSELCPTCGQRIGRSPLGVNPKELLSALARQGPNAARGEQRSVYKTQAGGWALTHGYHQDETKFWAWNIILDLEEQGLIEATYEGCNESFSLPKRAALASPSEEMKDG